MNIDIKEDNQTVVSVYRRLSAWVKGTEKVTVGSLSILIAQIIALVQEEADKRLQGLYKKQIAMTVMRMVIRDTITLTEEEKKEMLDVANKIAPDMIDTLIKVSKKEIDLHKIKASFLSCCKN